MARATASHSVVPPPPPLLVQSEVDRVAAIVCAAYAGPTVSWNALRLARVLLCSQKQLVQRDAGVDRAQHAEPDVCVRALPGRVRHAAVQVGRERLRGQRQRDLRLLYQRAERRQRRLGRPGLLLCVPFAFSSRGL